MTGAVTTYPEKRLRYLTAGPIRNGVGAASEHDDPAWPRYIRITDIAGPRDLRRDTFKSLPPHVAAQAPVARNDLLLAAVGATVGKSLFIADEPGPACYAGYLVRVRPGDGIEPRFLAYWTESTHYWHQIRARLVQATIENFSASKYRALNVPVPPLPAQRAIADFLDRKTAATDALIEKKERLIALLEEKRQALITQAVTKGLDPTVPMKDSGIPWLGEIPAHWEVLPLKALSNGMFTDGDWVETPYITDSGIRLLQTGNIGVGTYREQGYRYISEESFSKLRCTEVRPRDLLICRLADPVGRACIAPDLGVRMITSVDVCILRCRPEYDHAFLNLLFASRGYLDHIASICRGGTRDRISRSMLGAVRLPVPPTSEQLAIADGIGDKIVRIDSLVGGLRASMTLLREYRSAIITACVTGKRAVS